jgi:protein SCO1
MNPSTKKFPWTVGIGLLLLVLTLSLLYLVVRLKREMIRHHLPVIGPVAEFSLMNQDGAAVSLAPLKGHVWVADIIFTRCPGPCARMTQQMKELQDALAGSPVKLVSLTTDPDFDTPAVLKQYAARAGADPTRWLFLTGTKKEIAALAANSLKLTTVEVPAGERQSENDLFIHSTIFVVVDKHGKLRGNFQTVGEDIDWTKAKQQILSAVKQLEREK